VQQDGAFTLRKIDRTAKTALGVLPGRSHSGKDIGILTSVRSNNNGTHPTLQWVLRCLTVSDADSYNTVATQLDSLTALTQESEKEQTVTNRYCMFVFRITDDRGNELSDYDVVFTAGPDYNENHLPPGFFVDRQRNQLNPGKLTYYIDYDVMANGINEPGLDGKFGFRITAQPTKGFAHYTAAEHQGTLAQLKQYFAPNQTLMVDVQLRRHVYDGVFRLTHKLKPEDFRKQEKGNEIT
jgi:hypothetical protein